MRIDENAHGKTPAKWARLRAKTRARVLAEARADPDALPVEDGDSGGLGRVGRVALAKRIRWRLGLSQAEFARSFRIPLGTLHDWEQHRRESDRRRGLISRSSPENPKQCAAHWRLSPRRLGGA
jgi:putative transcriptional regulator